MRRYRGVCDSGRTPCAATVVCATVRTGYHSRGGLSRKTEIEREDGDRGRSQSRGGGICAFGGFCTIMGQLDSALLARARTGRRGPRGGTTDDNQHEFDCNASPAGVGHAGAVGTGRNAVAASPPLITCREVSTAKL